MKSKIQHSAFYARQLKEKASEVRRGWAKAGNPEPRLARVKKPANAERILVSEGR